MPKSEQIRQIAKCDANLLTVWVDSTVSAAAKIMRDHNVGCLIVVDPQSRITGIISERDLVGRVLALSRDPERVRVGEAMTPDVMTCTMDTSVTQAEQMMTAYGIRHLPVTQAGYPIGIVSMRDLLAHRLAQAKETIERQASILQELEKQHPGISELHHDDAGRVVI